MAEVEIRWRPSGGRGEYEHVPQDVLLDLNIVIEAISVPAIRIKTDVWGRMRDDKPRIRRERPNDRSMLNIAPLIAALALLPDPRREDKGFAALPLKDKSYVISAISFKVAQRNGNRAVCTPKQLRILHDNSTIDLVDRLIKIGVFLNDHPSSINALVEEYIAIVKSGLPHAALRDVADRLIEWLIEHPEVASTIEAPSDKFVVGPTTEQVASVTPELSTLTADETKRRLVSHYMIDRNTRIRKAKVALFQSANNRIFCENCTFDFGYKYGKRGHGFIEVHHLLPLAALLPNSITSLSDLMLLCSNCHRMVHRTRPPLEATELKLITRV